MVMEAATLSNPHRKFTAVPVQKSLSLPSYARAGGEGIDHQLIFAALEQKEKVRRKSRIFTREKSSRQTVFCLPLPISSAKCRETSFSSDTSCSSLEYQKPVAKQDKKPKKEDVRVAAKVDGRPKKEETTVETPKGVPTRNEAPPPNRLDPMRLTAPCSSDSMDRSSRSSTDSLSRKEWLVAVKARVEAAREKYGNGSSSDEEPSSMTRYNSDGLIHRTGRDTSGRPSRYDKRMRRRSQDEVALKKLSKKNDLSLSLETKTRPLEVKTDFCPSPNSMPDVLKKNYFSDFRESNAAKFVRARIRHIEDEERKRRSGSDFKFDRQSPLGFDSPVSTESRRQGSNALHAAFADAARSSPIPRSSQAPTPPPRSPKSITFVNKAFLQHQNAAILHHESSLERKRLMHQNNPAFHSPKLFDQFNAKSEAVIADSITDVSEKQKIRELICSRRKTCGNFDFMDENMFSDITPVKGSTSSNSSSVTNTNSPSVPQSKKIESKGYFSGSEMHCSPVEDPVSKLWKSKWQENDQRREYMFNSLESKRKCNTPSWLKWKSHTPENNNPPQSFLDYKSSYSPKEDVNVKPHSNVSELINQLDNITRQNSKELSSLNVQYPSDRLSKSEANIALKEKAKIAPEVKENNMSRSSEKITRALPDPKIVNKAADKISASANLESAMEELESVYQSLKISSDNLSDKGIALNSVDDKDLKKSKVTYKSIKDEIGFKRRSSVCESNLRSLHIKTDFQDLIRMTERKPNPMPDLLKCLGPKESSADQLSIDELFNDLTQQLDLEQKLLKEPRDSKTPTKICSQPNRFPSPLPSNPQPSQFSIRKEFFDNLSRGNRNKNLSEPVEPPPPTKKKYKAVRSLSENISLLMATANPNPKQTSVMKAALDEDNASKTAAIEQYYERARDPSRKDLSCNSPSPDEIRHIRVSMDTAQPRPVIRDKLPATKHYARLSSSVCSSPTQVSPKLETPPQPSFTDLSHSNILDASGVDQLINSLLGDEPSKDPTTRPPEASPPNSCNSKESDVLEEGLEKLLNRLLGDVPDRPQSSLLPSKDSPTPPGEMRVMQHLDIIRLKPVPT